MTIFATDFLASSLKTKSSSSITESMGRWVRRCISSIPSQNRDRSVQKMLMTRWRDDCCDVMTAVTLLPGWVLCGRKKIALPIKVALPIQGLSLLEPVITAIVACRFFVPHVSSVTFIYYLTCRFLSRLRFVVSTVGNGPEVDDDMRDSRFSRILLLIVVVTYGMQLISYHLSRDLARCCRWVSFFDWIF